MKLLKQEDVKKTDLLIQVGLWLGAGRWVESQKRSDP